MQSAASDLSLIESAARDAGGLVRELLRQPLEVRSKGDEGPVTNIDIAVDAFLNERLRTARPGYGWLSEEAEDRPEERRSKATVFMIDPIDGTAALVARIPQFTISVGIVRDEAAFAGAIYNPMTDELYSGARGLGAALNGAPVRASARAALQGARIVGDKRRFASKRWTAPWPDMEIFSRQSIAYRLGLVAAAQADATILFGSKNEWDTAAGAAIVEAAGGVVTDSWGAPLKFNQLVPRGPGAVAAGAALHALLIERTSQLPDPRKAASP